VSRPASCCCSTTLAEAWALRQSMLKSKARSERTIATEKYLLEKCLADRMPRELASFTREDVRRKHAALTTEIARGRPGTPTRVARCPSAYLDR